MRSIAESLLGLIFIVAFTLFLRWFVPYTWVWTARIGAATDWIAVPLFVALVYFGVALVVTTIVSERVSEPRDFSTALIFGLLSAGPIPSAYLWYRLGVPPTSAPFLAGIPFGYIEALTGVIVIIACSFIAATRRSLGPLESAATAWFLVLFNLTFFAFAPFRTVRQAELATETIRATAINWKTCSAETTQPLIIHISDIHINNGCKTLDGGFPGNSQMLVMINELNRYSPAYVVISGDITDTGDADQWTTLVDLISKAKPDIRFVITPGNHDLNRFFGRDPDIYDIRDNDRVSIRNSQGVPRIGRVLLFQHSVLPTMKMYDGRSLESWVADVPTTKASLETAKESIEKCIDDCIRPFEGSEGALKIRQGCHFRCNKDWRLLRLRGFASLEGTFPWYFVDIGRRVAFISLASTIRRTYTVGENAIGYIDDAQIERLGGVLMNLPREIETLVVTSHHPPYRSRTPSFPDVNTTELLHPVTFWHRIYNSEWFLSVFLQNDAVQAQKLLRTLKTFEEGHPQASILFMYGHRHQRSLASVDGLILEEAPNLATHLSDEIGFFSIVRNSSSTHQIQWCPVAPSPKQCVPQ